MCPSICISIATRASEASQAVAQQPRQLCQATLIIWESNAGYLAGFTHHRPSLPHCRQRAECKL